MRSVKENPSPLKKVLFYDDKSKLWYLASDQFNDINQKIYRKSKYQKEVLAYAKKLKRFKEDVTIHKKKEKFDSHRIFSGFERFQKIKKDMNLLMRQYDKVQKTSVHKKPDEREYKKLLKRFQKVADKARSLNVGSQQLRQVAEYMQSIEGKESGQVRGKCTMISAESGKLYNTRVFFDRMFLYKVFQQAQWIAKSHNFIDIMFEFIAVDPVSGDEQVIDYFEATYAANFFEPVLLPRQGFKGKKKRQKQPEQEQYYNAVGDFLNSVSEDLTETLQDLSEDMRMDFDVLATLSGGQS